MNIVCYGICSENCVRWVDGKCSLDCYRASEPTNGHLCNSCQYTMVTCPSVAKEDVLLGNKGICACKEYKSIFENGESN